MLSKAILFLVLTSGALAQSSHHYAVILQDAPAAERFISRENLRSNTAQLYRRRIQDHQNQLRSALAARRITVTGSSDTVLNAVYVSTSPAGAEDLRSMPGVLGVVEMRRARRFTNKATQLVNAPAAWNALGGADKSGAGVKIAILDTGIDHTHAAF